jgi:hypothetical protein
MSQRNNDAVDQLPIRLMMSLAIIAAIVVLVVSASGTLRTFFAEQQVESQCRLLEASLSTMAESGAVRDVDDLNAAEGTKRVQTFTLPESLVYLSFGGDPDPSNTGSFSSKLVEDGAVIFYKVQGGSRQIIWLPKETYKFREGTFVDDYWRITGEGKSFLIHTGGTVTLVFERVQKNHMTYILVHTTDDIDL